MPELRFDRQHNVDETLIQLVMYEDEQVAGTVILTPKGALDFREQARRTKIKFTGFDDNIKVPGQTKVKCEG